MARPIDLLVQASHLIGRPRRAHVRRVVWRNSRASLRTVGQRTSPVSRARRVVGSVEPRTSEGFDRRTDEQIEIAADKWQIALPQLIDFLGGQIRGLDDGLGLEDRELSPNRLMNVRHRRVLGEGIGALKIAECHFR